MNPIGSIMPDWLSGKESYDDVKRGAHEASDKYEALGQEKYKRQLQSLIMALQQMQGGSPLRDAALGSRYNGQDQLARTIAGVQDIQSQPLPGVGATSGRDKSLQGMPPGVQRLAALMNKR